MENAVKCDTLDLVSIVVVTRNQSDVVTETLDSIYNQTYSRIELIVSDDFSKDDTVENVKRWVADHRERFEDVRLLISQTNVGVTKNCNKGMLSSNGVYAQLIAGDDLLLPTAIEEKVAFSKKTGLPWFVTKVEIFGSDQARIQLKNSYCEKGYEIISKGYEAQVENIIYGNYIQGPAASFFEMAYFRKIGGYDERYTMMEDYPFIFHYLMGGNEIVLLDKALVRYRVSGRSLSTNKKSPLYNSVRKFFFREQVPQLLKRGKIGYVLYRIARFGYEMLQHWIYAIKAGGKKWDR